MSGEKILLTNKRSHFFFNFWRGEKNWLNFAENHYVYYYYFSGRGRKFKHRTIWFHCFFLVSNYKTYFYDQYNIYLHQKPFFFTVTSPRKIIKIIVKLTSKAQKTLRRFFAVLIFYSIYFLSKLITLNILIKTIATWLGVI